MDSSPGSQIRSFVEERFPGVAFADDDDIFALGFINSLFSMQLVLFIEERIGFPIPEEDLARENFRSIDSMAGLVERHREPSEQ
ncbi:phosphopantetheine-binding protein [Streptomyces solisilvae]|uniref:phosphopantetheine-binding protein n=1 Tax=Streptomyces malaysiensis TaxID=92644 RepID=UPI00367F0E1B